jgi:hypothetical protein
MGLTSRGCLDLEEEAELNRDCGLTVNWREVLLVAVQR